MAQASRIKSFRENNILVYFKSNHLGKTAEKHLLILHAAFYSQSRMMKYYCRNYPNDNLSKFEPSYCIIEYGCLKFKKFIKRKNRGTISPIV